MLNVIWILFPFIFLSFAEEKCKRNFSIRKNAIILTKSSQAKGAMFIHKQAISRFPECYALCCSNPECTVAVYENKVSHICFLFNCKQPNVCSFTEHIHYISMMYIKPEVKTIKQSNPKSELMKPSADGKLGELCGALRKCGPENSMCTSGTCICQIGFIGRNGECVRSMCPKPELMFQCFDVTKMPFCVALYDQCNGLSECGDGSDELNCEDKSSAKSVIQNTTNIVQNPVKVERKMVNPVANVNSYNSLKHSKEQLNTDDRQMFENINTTYPYRFHKSLNQKSLGPHRINPLIENQLLVLESKNSVPKYSYSNHVHKNAQRPYAKSEGELSDSNNNQVYENRQYSKHKTPSYPHLTKLDEYYQKNAPESSDNNNRWNNADSYYDYDYPPSSNNRDQGSSWYGDKSSNSYSDSAYPDNTRYDHNAYLDYPDSDDDMNSKQRGPDISENDYYNSRGYSHKSLKPLLEHKMSYQNKEKTHRIFIKPKEKPNSVDKISISTSKDNIKIGAESLNIDNINTQEWSTAVIMLSLGLLVTAVLLIAIAIKMRSWRRILRKGKKGKSLTTDEGDYLINGMYL